LCLSRAPVTLRAWDHVSLCCSSIRAPFSYWTRSTLDWTFIIRVLSNGAWKWLLTSLRTVVSLRSFDDVSTSFFDLIVPVGGHVSRTITIVSADDWLICNARRPPVLNIVVSLVCCPCSVCSIWIKDSDCLGQSVFDIIAIDNTKFLVNLRRSKWRYRWCSIW
jgi:hypothetical protein